MIGKDYLYSYVSLSLEEMWSFGLAVINGVVISKYVTRYVSEILYTKSHIYFAAADEQTSGISKGRIPAEPSHTKTRPRMMPPSKPKKKNLNSIKPSWPLFNIVKRNFQGI